MTTLRQQSIRLLGRLQRRFGLAAGGWGVVARGAQTAAACVRGAGAGDGRLALVHLACLSPDGAQPARRLSDVVAVLRRPALPCALLIGHEDYQLQFMPGLPVAAAERTQALHWRLKDDLEFPSDEAVIECVTTPTQSPGGQNELWMVVVARRRRVYELVTPLRNAGASIEVVDIAELAQRNVAMRCVAPGRTVAMLTMDRQHGLLTIGRDDGLFASRQLDPLAVALAEDDPERRAGLIERLSLELQRTFDNVERQYGAGPIDRLILQVEPADPAIVEGLGNDLSVPVQTLDLAAVVDGAPELIERANASVLATLAIGAASRFCDPPGAGTAATVPQESAA